MILQQLSTYNMANDRGGLQPFEARDFFYQARDTLERHKDEVETLIEQMEKTLVTNSTSTLALWRRIKNLERAWTEFEAKYDWLRTIAGQGRLQDQVQAEQD